MMTDVHTKMQNNRKWGRSGEVKTHGLLPCQNVFLHLLLPWLEATQINKSDDANRECLQAFHVRRIDTTMTMAAAPARRQSVRWKCRNLATARAPLGRPGTKGMHGFRFASAPALSLTAVRLLARHCHASSLLWPPTSSFTRYICFSDLC